jgi:glycerol-3-phosphate acyltransferase PlsX
MNGDKAPSSNINGVLKYLIKNPKDDIYLVGKKTILKKYQSDFKSKNITNFKNIYAEDTISEDDSMTRLFKKKPECSLIKCIELLKNNKVDAIVSSGNTAALLSSSLIILGKIDGIRRPALGAFIPTEKGGFVLCDVGANSDNKPIHLLQFSLMATAYIKYLEDIKKPRIALLNIGNEAKKGNQLSIETYKLLDKYSENFIGNLESRYLLENKADIVICDGFTGNIVLKLIEGTINKMIGWTKKSINNHSVSKLAKPLLYPVFKDIKKNFDYEEHGGAPLLGVNGIVIKCHGASNEKAILNGLLHAKKCVENDFISKIKESLNKLKIEE